MAEPVDVSPAKGKAATVPVSPPPAKKLKQAVLPFKVLSAKPVTEDVTNDPNSGNSIKKRKLSDDNSGPIKAPKTPQSEEAKASKKSTDTENEVSSSSEPEAKHKNEAKVTKPKLVALLDKFIQSAQQQIVRTSCNDEVIDLVEEKNQCQTKSDISNEEDKDEASETTNDKNDDSVLNKTNESAQAEGSESGSQNELDNIKDAGIQPIDSNLLTPNASKSSIKKAPGSKKKTPKMSKEEKEKLVKEKEDKRQREKEEKERLKLEKKEERERKAKEEKEKKEKEKEEKRKKIEEEKQAKLVKKQQEEEEKKRQKEEERKRKAEEKRIELEKKKLEAEKLKEQKEAERLKEEAEKKQVSQAQKSLMKNFFIQKQKLETKMQKEKAEGNGLFMPFQVKSGTRLAPTVCVSRDDLMPRLAKFEPYFKSQDCEVLYLDELKKSPTPKLKGAELKTFPFDDDDDCMTLDEEVQHKKKERMRAKLLQFHENYRPAFYGTWRKQSKNITGRNPFGQDKAILDYEVDSDEEWEEEEPGESLSDADNDNKDDDEEADDDEEEDGFFVPHGYLSDGEGCEDDVEDATPERLKARQLAKARAFEADLNKKTEVLKPIIVGCYWQDQTIDLVPQMLEQFRMVTLAPQTPIEIVEQPIETPSRIKKTKKEKKTSTGVKGAIPQQVPDDAFPDLIRLVNGNSKGLPKLIREFREYWRLKETGGEGKEDISPIEEDALNKDDAKDDAVNKTKAVDSNEKINDSAKLDSEMIDTSVTEGSENAPERDGNCEKKVYSISKRQLEKTIKEIAVYEKRGDYNKLCWYVKQSVLEKYNLKELPMPTNWQWITMPAPKINDTQNAPSPIGKEIPSGRTTPSQGNPASSGSITKFTVAGITPKVYTPDPMKPKTESPLVRPSITKFLGGEKGTNKLIKKVEASIPLSAEIQYVENGSDDDCAIVAMNLKPEKKQPKIMSIFQATPMVDEPDSSDVVAKLSVKQPQKSPKTGGKKNAADFKKNKAVSSAKLSVDTACNLDNKKNSDKPLKEGSSIKKKTPQSKKNMKKITPKAVASSANNETELSASKSVKSKSPGFSVKKKTNGDKNGDIQNPASVKKDSPSSLNKGLKRKEQQMSLDEVVKKIYVEAENLKKDKVKVNGLGSAEAPMEID